MRMFRFDDEAWAEQQTPSMLGLTKDALERLEAIRPAGGGQRLMWRELPFYPDAGLLRIECEAWPPQTRLCYLCHRGALHHLDGTARPIHTINAAAPIDLSRDNALYYLSFFCFFVRGDQGAFFLIDELDNPLLPARCIDYRNSGRMQRSIRDVYRPPKLESVAASGEMRAAALIYYANCVFFSDFIILPSGMIEMVHDQYLVMDLPDEIQVPLELPDAGQDAAERRAAPRDRATDTPL